MVISIITFNTEHYIYTAEDSNKPMPVDESMRVTRLRVIGSLYKSSITQVEKKDSIVQKSFICAIQEYKLEVATNNAQKVYAPSAILGRLNATPFLHLSQHFVSFGLCRNNGRS